MVNLFDNLWPIYQELLNDYSFFLLLTVKSLGFTVITAFSLFGEQAAIPSAVFAVVVLLYLLFLTSKKRITKLVRN